MVVGGFRSFHGLVLWSALLIEIVLFFWSQYSKVRFFVAFYASIFVKFKSYNHSSKIAFKFWAKYL